MPGAARGPTTQTTNNRQNLTTQKHTPLSWDERGASAASGVCPGRRGALPAKQPQPPSPHHPHPPPPNHSPSFQSQKSQFRQQPNDHQPITAATPSPSPSIQPVGAVREPPYQPNQHPHHRITSTRQYPILSNHANVPDVGAGFKPALPNNHQPLAAATPSPQRARSTQTQTHLPPHLSPLPLGGRGLG